LTQEAGEAGALLGIDVLDHVVIAVDGFVSLREAGLYIPPPPSAASSGADSLAEGLSTQVRVPRSSSDEVEGCRYDCRYCGARVPGPDASCFSCQRWPRRPQRRMPGADREFHATELVQPAAA
jgi:hypothetical protein